MGTICLLDKEPREFFEHEGRVLTHLADILSDTLALHLAKVRAASEAEESRQRADTLTTDQARTEMAALRLAALVDSSDDAVIGTDLNSIVTSWNQGMLGLEPAREHRPDLVLLDVHLPDLPGWEVLQSLRAGPGTREVPVIMLSADATERQMERLLKAGARAYLTKPLDVPEFLALLDDTLTGQPL